MNWNTVLFLIIPYAIAALAVVATSYRLVVRPHTVSSLSSQILESRTLFWGSISFHWGLLLVLAGHLVALLASVALLPACVSQDKLLSACQAFS